jgi:anti-sigma factor ChrR (cupin superfamily)
MSGERFNADFAQRVVMATDRLPWLPSPQAGVERRMLDRIGGEVARATSIVRYATASTFPPHEHGLGEEFLVLDGVFADEYGDYPAGTYVRNPPGSRHAPRTSAGCTIFVKLRQMTLAERDRVVIDTTEPWTRERLLHADGNERVTLQRLGALDGASASDCPGGEEILVLSGLLEDEHGLYKPRTWIRNPHGFRRSLKSAQGTVYWHKQGHLRRTAA